MLRRSVGRIMWVGKATTFCVGLAVVLALILGFGVAALAAVPGDPFRLGQNNAINNALTALGGSRAGGAMMLVDNNSAAAGSRALDLRTERGRAPLTVNADAGKAPNLDADKVDGSDAPLWAAVDGNGAIERTRGATGSLRDGQGFYTVTFNRDVRGCAYSATLNAFQGNINARSSFFGGRASVDVSTTTIVDDSSADLPFYLVVFC